MNRERANEPAYLGSGTFCKTPAVATVEDLRGADVAIVGAPLDSRVTNRPGTRLGPRAIRAACPGTGSSRPHLTLGVDPMVDLAVVDYGDIEPKPADLEGHVAQLRERVREVLDAGAVPVVLGGDHSIAYATIGALSERLGAGGFCVVQFDTHADTGEIYGGRLTHGNPFRLLIDEGRLDGDRLWQIGLRGYWPGPSIFAWMREAGIRWRTMDDVQHAGVDAVVNEVVAALAPLDCPVYISLDVDVLDPAFAPGTGTPEPGGLTMRELLRALRTLASELPLAGLEVVEVSPPYDHADITALAAHRCILETLAAVAARRQ